MLGIFYRKFPKKVVKLRPSTSNCMVYEEVGKLPLQMYVDKQLISYWLHILDKDKNTLAYTTYILHILRLQRIQNQAARILTKTPRRDHITEVLIDLHWLRIEARIVYKLLILTFKAFIDRTAPLDLCELIEQQKSSTNTRTRLANDAFF